MAEKEKSPREQIEAIKKKALVKGKDLQLIYDSFGEGLEPSYYWVLDFLREDIGYEVEKIYDQFAAAEASGYFGELGQRRTVLEKRAMEIMQTLGVIVKSILQLLWDMKEFELRLDHYDKLKSKKKEEIEAADNALKAIWLTDVDIKKGRGSINVLTQDLNFVTLRDAFMIAKSVKDVKGMDLNDRVKRILEYKIKEYLDWRKRSEAELRKRYQVEKAWLKSQVNAMKLYTRWAKPYLIATKKLMPIGAAEIVGAEELVTAFDVMRIDLIVLGESEVREIPRPGKSPKAVFPPKPEDGKDIYEDDRIYSVIEVEFRFRSTPGEVTKGHYTHRGKTEILFRPYVLNGAEIKKIKTLEEDEVLQFLEGMTTESLSAMRDDLAKYVEEPITEKEKKIVKEIKLPFVKEIKGMVAPFVEISKGLKALKVEKKKPKKPAWEIERLRKVAEATVADDVWLMYKTYKEAHKMIKW